ncbi:MAG TPA: DoxX family protein [Stellaceae bacterium]|nr:DoxX family protein [Stellaceae bacterium]
MSAGEPRLIVPALGPVYRALGGCGDLLLRIMCGALLLPPGWHKLTGPLFDRDVELFHQLGFEPAVPLMWFITALELVGGLCLILGLLTRPIALMVAVEMLVIAIAVDIPNGRGYSFTLLWAAVAIAIFLRGGGRLSVDRWIGREF